MFLGLSALPKLRPILPSGPALRSIFERATRVREGGRVAKSTRIGGEVEEIFYHHPLHWQSKSMKTVRRPNSEVLTKVLKQDGTVERSKFIPHPDGGRSIIKVYKPGAKEYHSHRIAYYSPKGGHPVRIDTII